MARPLFRGEVVAFLVVWACAASSTRKLFPHHPPSQLWLSFLECYRLHVLFSSFSLKLEYLLWILEYDGLKGNYVCTSEKNNIFRCLISKLKVNRLLRSAAEFSYF